jgi:hypothetical protein
MDKPTIIVHVQKSVNYTLFDCKWIPVSPRFVLLGQYPKDTGALQVYEVSHGEIKLVKEVTYWISLGFPMAHYLTSYRGLARDVIHDVTDGRRHVGGIFFAPRGTF